MSLLENCIHLWATEGKLFQQEHRRKGYKTNFALTVLPKGTNLKKNQALKGFFCIKCPSINARHSTFGRSRECNFVPRGDKACKRRQDLKERKAIIKKHQTFPKKNLAKRQGVYLKKIRNRRSYWSQWDTSTFYTIVIWSRYMCFKRTAEKFDFYEKQRFIWEQSLMQAWLLVWRCE